MIFSYVDCYIALTRDQFKQRTVCCNTATLLYLTEDGHFSNSAEQFFLHLSPSITYDSLISCSICWFRLSAFLIHLPNNTKKK